MEPSPPETSEEPAELVEAAQKAEVIALDAPPPQQEPEPSDELVSWAHAQHGLNHERDLHQRHRAWDRLARVSDGAS
jgi:hypothetical protein